MNPVVFEYRPDKWSISSQNLDRKKKIFCSQFTAFHNILVQKLFCEFLSLEASSELKTIRSSGEPLNVSIRKKVLMQLSGRFLLTNVSQIGICGACKILLSNFINKYLRFRPLITFRWAVFIWWDYSHYRRHRFDLMNSIVCSAAEFKCGQPLVKVTIIQLWKKVSKWNYGNGRIDLIPIGKIPSYKWVHPIKWVHFNEPPANKF